MSRQLGPYKFIGPLGAGGMGEVHAAEDTRLGRKVALKLLSERIADDEEYRIRFEREAKAAAALNHPGIVTLHSFEELDGVCFLTMELVQGEPLAARVREGGLQLKELLEIGIQLADAVAAAHALGIVHRDLKPANVMITPEGRVKILDFGLARRDAPAKEMSDSTLASEAGTTRAGQVLGTAAYMSPEQAGGGLVDHRADLWSLGVVLYELATGRRPFQGATFAALSAAVLRDEPAALSTLRTELPAELSAVVGRLLQKSVERRLDSATSLRDVLQAVRDGTTSTSSNQAAIPRVRGNLPRQRTSFLGRERELEAFADQLRPGSVLTLTGVGGCGKTRLAIELASRVQAAHADGAFLVELAALTEPDLIAKQVATALGLGEEPSRRPDQLVLEHVRERALLLVLDNCEHMLSECARLVDSWLEDAPGLTVIATSREGLGVIGETLRQVGSLSVPPSGASLEEALSSESLRLVLERATAVRAGFSLSEDNLADLVAICRRLDGIPLALELAAARLSALSPHQVVARLDDAFKLLTGGSRTALERQQTLRATLDWSYELLTELERTLYRRLAVFAGGWTLELAEAVCSGEGLLEEEIVAQLTHLVDRSLVVVDQTTAEPRYRFLEPVRQHARDLLVASGEAGSARNHHVEALMTWSAGLETAVAAQQTSSLARLLAEIDNIRSALEHALSAGGPVTQGLWIFANCCCLWTVHGHHLEGARLGRALLAKPEAAERGAARAWALGAASSALILAWDSARAIALAEEAIAIAREIGEVRLEVRCRVELSSEAMLRSSYAEARDHAARALELARTLDDDDELSRCLNTQASVDATFGEFVSARRSWEEQLATARRNGHDMGVASTVANLGAIALSLNELDEARALEEEALAIFRRLEHRAYTAWRLVTLAQIATRQGRSEDAVSLLAEGEVMLRSFAHPAEVLLLEVVRAWRLRWDGDPLAAGSILRAVFAELARTNQPAIVATAAMATAFHLEAQGLAADAALMDGAAQSLLGGSSGVHEIAQPGEIHALRAGLVLALGVEAAEAARAEGAAMSPGEICELGQHLLSEDAVPPSP
jgi:non-specific serine/threonine protein kinase